MDEATRVLVLTRRVHAIAASPEGALLTLAELERMAAEQLDQEQAQDEPEGSRRAGRPG